MKKTRCLLPLLFVLLLLSGCAFKPQVQTMKGWSFQYNSGTDDYSLFFGLCDKNEKYLSASADVEIRIVNDRDELVYSGTKSITEDDFGTYSNQLVGERFLANVRISPSELHKGSSNSGTVYFTVTSDTFGFDEAQCDASYCLPIKDVQLNLPPLPVEVQETSSYFGVLSKVSITDVSYSLDDSSLSPCLRVTISGEKTYAHKTYGSGLSFIDYKLLDQDGYVVDSGSVYLDSSLSVGDKFRDDSLILRNIIPGETYSLQFSDKSMG